MRRTLYSLVLLTALPFILLRTLWRGLYEPGYREDIPGRFGVGRKQLFLPTLWLHAVSVGEVRAAAPLIATLRHHCPDHRILITQMTAAGRATAHQLYGDFADIAWLPWDLPWAQRAFLRRWRPTLGIVIETEIWPNLLHEARRLTVPVVLVNARLSARSAARYTRAGELTREVLADFSAIIAQTDADAARFASVGALSVAVAGNLKFDINPPAGQVDQGRHWHAALDKRRVLLLASTRDSEEALLLDALLPHLPTDVLIALVPRHPQRFDEVATLVTARGLSLCRRSSGALPAADTRVWLGDAMGEMFAWYALADLALIGGSWLPLGGQNLIEACAVGCPVLIGPHTFNFAQATEDAIAAGAAVRVDDVHSAAREAGRLLAEPATLKAMGEAGRAFAQAHRGATARTMALIEPLLPDAT
ncbi:MAG: lipid IV(A) 3-deoxy-D-manno-octulosonic acid transferase [Methyloversatilis discipulorum]|uniref:lipid IV(A) 3-deoxy-D-manno-octulosonic acid transferase n=1 Tax=Methyloversatilis discipulorum TaxID=1119528 RepID=UPI0026EA5850|nr:lipid IV(A) 3-deoxy-D-manno-octulosonic acid transferase [Methyloversatilis discipulorum]MBT9516108.1 lipid IV(A) 3-deoxy-D-manno-octulosonic acid transferase [Methyloversatilis discipulorum]